MVRHGGRIHVNIGGGNNNDITGTKRVECKSHRILNPYDQRIQDDIPNLTFRQRFDHCGYSRQ